MTPSATGLSPSSGDFAALKNLSPEQRERLTEVLDRYLSALEQDAPLNKNAILAEHPDLAEPLQTYFRSLEELHDMAAGFGGSADHTEPAPQEAPAGAKQIGDFELLREIGRGGMGVVYEARQISLDRRVAVKLLPFAAVLDARQIARFKHEAQAAAQLHHPNIVPVFAIGVERGVHYYAMQYIDGQPLDRAIEGLRASQPRRRAKSASVSASLFGLHVPVAADETRDQCAAATLVTCLASRRSDKQEFFRTVMRLGVQAAEALNAAHEYGVVHRDIKPSNLLLEADGKLWVTDFGLARFQRDASITRTGDIVGTMRYMSPEQAAGHSARVDHRTDIYSLGVTLYELICLQPAFPEERGPALLKQIDSYDPPRLRQLQPGVPADLETVIAKAMSRERDDRYASAREMADDLRRVLEGKATAARPPTPADRIGRWARRHQRFVAGAAVSLLVAVAALSTGAVLVGQASIRASRHAARADRLYASAQQMLDQLGAQLADDLRDVPGADHVRQNLLQRTKSYYLDLLAETKDDPRLLSDAAATYGKLGALLNQLGSAEDALAVHRDAARLLSEAAAASPGMAGTQRLLALAENNEGLALARLGRGDEARKQYESARARLEKLLARRSRDPALESDLGAAQSNLGLLQQQRGERAEAAASFRSAIDRLKRAAELQPASVEHPRKLAAAYNNLASVFVDDQPKEAVRLHDLALRVLHEIEATTGNDLSLSRDLALTYNNLAAAHTRSKQYSPARAAYTQAIGIREELLRVAPARASYKGDLAVSLNNLGMLENRLGDWESAKTAFRRAADLYEALAAQFPGDNSLESKLAAVYNNTGITLERAGQLEAAALAFSDAIERQQAVYDDAPDFPRSRELLATHRENLARVQHRLGRTAEASGQAVAGEQTSTLPTLTQGQP